MAQVAVYMCDKGHLHYGDDPPKTCHICGSVEFGQITGVSVDVEDHDGISAESGYSNT